MGKKKSAKVAKPPDLNALADKTWQQQRTSNAEALTANRANQTNAFGSVNWSRDPTSGAWTQTEAYNPEQQALLNQQVKNQRQMGQMAGDVLTSADMDYSGAPAAPTVGGYNQQAIDTMRALRAPELQRSRNAKEAQLAAMGVGTGSGSAWDSTQANIGGVENEADLQAVLAGIQQGNTEFTQGMNLRNTYTGEQDRMLQNAGGMMSKAAPANLQFDDSYARAVSAGSPDYAGNALKQQQAQQAYNNAKAASKNSGGMLGGMGGTLGSMAGMAIGGPAGAAIGGALGGGLDSGSWEGAVQGGIGGYMGSGSGGWMSGLPGMSNAYSGYNDIAGAYAGVPQF